MPDVTLKFHGRFLYAQKSSDKTLTAVAPVFGGDFPPHQPLMSIRHDHVQFKEKKHGTKTITTLDPLLRIMAEANPQDPQIMVWDLTGCTVTYVTPDSPAGAITGSKEVASLKELEDNENRTAVANQNALMIGQGFANALVVLTNAGKTSSAHTVPYSFSHEDKAKLGQASAIPKKGSNPPQALRKEPAEIVAFDVSMPAAPAGEDQRLTLKIEKGGNLLGFVCIKKGGVVCFSHACAKIHEQGDIDLEFMRYYDALMAHDPKALIPFDNGTELIEGIPCYQQSQMSF